MANQILDMLNNMMPSQNQQGQPTSLNDPRMGQAIEYVKNHGGNPKQAFYDLCKERLINPDTIIKSIIGNR